MSKITNIAVQVNNQQRVSIYIDYKFCCGLTIIEVGQLNVEINSVISCSELLQKFKELNRQRSPERYECVDLNAHVIVGWITKFRDRNFYFLKENNKYHTRNNVLCDYILKDSEIFLSGVPKNFWGLASKYRAEGDGVNFEFVDIQGLKGAVAFLNYVGISFSALEMFIGENDRSEYNRFFKKSYYLLEGILSKKTFKDFIDLFEFNKIDMVYFSTLHLGGQNVKLSKIDIDEIWRLVRLALFKNER